MNVIKKQTFYVITLIAGTQLAPFSGINLEKSHSSTQASFITTSSLSKNQENLGYFAYSPPSSIGHPRRSGGSGARWIPQSR
jgi:hypothetical protein